MTQAAAGDGEAEVFRKAGHGDHDGGHVKQH